MHTRAPPTGHLHETAPAATDLKHIHTRPDPQQIACALILGSLRIGQTAVYVAVEPRRRVRHALVKPEPIKIVTQVVMQVDIAATATAAVPAQEVAQAQE